jgi:hypothetical protein
MKQHEPTGWRLFTHAARSIANLIGIHLIRWA